MWPQKCPLTLPIKAVNQHPELHQFVQHNHIGKFTPASKCCLVLDDIASRLAKVSVLFHAEQHLRNCISSDASATWSSIQRRLMHENQAQSTSRVPSIQGRNPIHGEQGQWNPLWSNTRRKWGALWAQVSASENTKTVWCRAKISNLNLNTLARLGGARNAHSLNRTHGTSNC